MVLPELMYVLSGRAGIQTSTQLPSCSLSYTTWLTQTHRCPCRLMGPQGVLRGHTTSKVAVTSLGYQTPRAVSLPELESAPGVLRHLHRECSSAGPAPMAIDASPVLAFWSTHLVHLFLQGPLMLFHLLPWRPGGAHSVRYKMHSNHKTEIRVQKTSREAGGAQVLGPENHSRGISFFLGLTGVAEGGIGNIAPMIQWREAGRQARGRMGPTFLKHLQCATHSARC